MPNRRNLGLVTQIFKVGPDTSHASEYERVTGRKLRNLDGWMMNEKTVIDSFRRYTIDADIVLIDGTAGLYDSSDGHSDSGTTAEIAKWLDAPVVLVLDCSTLGRSATAVARGFRDTDFEIDFKGIILNKINGPAQARSIADALDPIIPVLGFISVDSTLAARERSHCLAMPAWEPQGGGILHDEMVVVDGSLQPLSSYVAKIMTKSIDLERLLAFATSSVPEQGERNSEKSAPAPVTPDDLESLTSTVKANSVVRIAVAQDTAFDQVYQENLDLLTRAGAELAYFSPLFDTCLPPDVAGVYLGDGRPELHALELSNNRHMRAALATHAHSGGVIYAECGGLLLLVSALQPRGEAPYPMAGVFPFKAIASKSTKASGYVEIETTKDCSLFEAGLCLKGYVEATFRMVREEVLGGTTDAGTTEDTISQQSWREWKAGYRIMGPTCECPEVLEGFSCANVLGSTVRFNFSGYPELANQLIQKCRAVDVATVTAAVLESASLAETLELAAPPPPHRLSTPSSSIYTSRSSPELNRHPQHRRDGSKTQFELATMAAQQQRLATYLAPPPPQQQSPRGPMSRVHSAASLPLSGAGDYMTKMMHMHRASSGDVSVDPDSDDHIPTDYHRTPRFASGSLPTMMNKLDLSRIFFDGTLQPGNSQRISPSATPHNWHTSNGAHHLPSDKIASLSPGVTEMLWALGLGGRVVAVSDGCDHPVEATSRPKVRRRSLSALAVNKETDNASSVNDSSSSPLSSQHIKAVYAAAIDEQVLARERPGLVVYEDDAPPNCSSGRPEDFADGPTGRAVHEALVSVGQHPLVVPLRCSSLSDALDAMIALGEAAGVVEEAIRIVDGLRKKLRVVASQSAAAALNNDARPKVLVLKSLKPLRTAGRWAPDAAQLAGGADELQQPGDAPMELTWQQIVEYAPEVLVVAGVRPGGASRILNDLCDLAGSPGWWLLPAVKSAQVYVCDEALFCRPGPRLVDGVEALAKMCHQEAVYCSILPKTVLKLSLRPGQRCRQRLLPNYFAPFNASSC